MKRSYDAILLLGLKLNADGSPREELLLRIRKATQCYHKGLSPLIIPCGGQTPGTPITEAAVMEQHLLQADIPQEAIIKEDTSQITVENMLRAKQVLCRDNPHVLIVTSHYHALRARIICRRSAHMKASTRSAYIPYKLAPASIRLEPLRLIDYLLGFQDSDKKRPKWYLKIMYGLGIPDPNKKPD